MGFLFKNGKSYTDVKLDRADEKAQKRPDGSLVLVQTYLTSAGLAKDSQRMAGAGWRIESQIAPSKNRTVVTWVKPGPTA